MLVMEFVLTITSFFVPQCEAFFITRAYAQEVTTEEKNDTTQRKKPRYSVRKTTTETSEDVRHRSTDLEDPDNLKTEVTYDEESDTYNVGTTLVKSDPKEDKKKKKTADKKNNPNNETTDKNATNVKLGSYLPTNLKGFNLTTATTYLTPPLTMTTEEYMNWSLRQSMAQYYRQRNQELFQLQGNAWHQ